MRKASIVAGSIAAATAGSAIFGGVALAGNHCHEGCHSHHHHGDHNTRGGDAYGGNATNNCINLGLNLLSGIGALGGQGGSDAGTCSANANASGGDAY